MMFVNRTDNGNCYTATETTSFAKDNGLHQLLYSRQKP